MQLGITILPDNRKQDRYFYHIIVLTGNRKDAGTKSKVTFTHALTLTISLRFMPCRCNSSSPANKTRASFERSPIPVDAFCSEAASIPFSWLFPREYSTFNSTSGIRCALFSRSLGPLNYIRVWHDSAGQGAAASWFLKYVIVRDLKTGEKSYFICQQWLAVEKGDGRVSATSIVSTLTLIDLCRLIGGTCSAHRW